MDGWGGISLAGCWYLGWANDCASGPGAAAPGSPREDKTKKHPRGSRGWGGWVGGVASGGGGLIGGFGLDGFALAAFPPSAGGAGAGGDAAEEQRAGFGDGAQGKSVIVSGRVVGSAGDK